MRPFGTRPFGTRLFGTRLRTGTLRAALAAALLLGAGACGSEPAAGGERFTLFMSPADEARIGREQHGKILEQFGGAYRDPDLARYVDGIGRLLARTSERPDLAFTFTVLDTPIVNAFALPGGYVYVTRGLVGLADNEAELASVLAHEIGHVTARHAAERYSRTVVAGLGLTLLGVLSGSQIVNDLAGITAELVLKGYSREQELEADTLGVRYLARAGFDPGAMVAFLHRLQDHDALEAQIAGQPGAADQFSFFSTHPRTADRIRQAITAAGGTRVPDPIVGREPYLGKIDGLIYGDNPEQGFVKGRLFAHPRLRFRFEVPPGFRILNGPDQVVAIGPEGARILFSAAGPEAPVPMTAYLTAVWGQGLTLREVEAITVNGMEAATGRARIDTREGPMDLRLVAIAFGPRRIYRFAFLSPPRLTASLEVDLRRTTYSFRMLTPAEAEALRPLRIRVVTAGPGDTPESLARRQPFEAFSLERLRVLNGLAPGEPLAPGRKVKIVTE